MSVLDRFVHPLSAQERLRGRQWVERGAVAIINSGANSLDAIVTTDTGPHRASLQWTEAEIRYSCDCDAFREQEVCEHIVATALAAEAAGHIPTPPSRQTLPRRRDRAPIWLSPRGDLRRADIDEPRPAVHHKPSPPTWKKLLAKLKEAETAPPPAAAESWPPERQVLYIVDIPASLEERGLVVKLACRDRKSNDQWSKPKTRGISFPEPSKLASAEDQQILALLKGAAPGPQTFLPSYDPAYRVPQSMRRLIVPLICHTGRALLRLDPDADELNELIWEDDPWEFRVEVRRDETAQQYVFAAILVRHEERIPASRPLLALGGGIVVFADKAAPLDDGGALHWLTLLRQHRAMHVPFAQANELLAEMLSSSHLPRLELPEELRLETVKVAPRPRLRVRVPGREEYRPERLRAELSVDYDGLIVRAAQGAGRVVFQPQARRLILRDREAEQQAAQRLKKLGLREALGHSDNGPEVWFNGRHLPRLVRTLVNEGWHVEADGKLYRQPSRMRMNVSSGIDWFELRGDIDFGASSARLPDLLAAIKRGESVVRLDDGTFGMIPEAWLKKYALLAGIGTEEEDFIKFAKTQAGLLDALLASQPEVSCDEVFERTRAQLRSFQGINPLEAPPAFVGQLRPYQREGLGWFEFLRRFGFGGCLADDMGLGKTVQVLALLESRRQLRTEQVENQNSKVENSIGPSLVVVPRSLVFNWQQEAQRFTPHLRLLDHTGIDRIRSTDHLPDYDLVITTYGTLRRDAAFLKDVDFDYVVLDEAQAIKNPASESAKAVRLVRGHHRLALSGTPVQNHLGDLWSLFDFLNPGMMGAAAIFTNGNAALRNPDEETRTFLAQALRPFILRRTKEQVASDLPARLEQTIYCELDAEQRKVYDEMREYYRRSLFDRISREGLGKSKIQILEALLRLRQAALHPGLIDQARIGESSAKLDVLLPQLEEIIDEGHKALVFSQFTSMLSILRQRLDQEGIAYEYLDGKTHDRQARVERFQADSSCKLFLISLKAGGLGLNLTAADYVFLLDPWWNPAVEQQAIDRAHRIGQTKQVYACRLIAKDTVEEKVLSLQQSKRDLADAIITADNSLIRSLAREDLELLLS